MKHLREICITLILRDPGAVSWVMRKSKRPSSQERKRSPWDSTLNWLVPKPIKILVCDWAQKHFCAQSESSPFRVTSVTSYSKEFADNLFDHLFAILVRLLQESFLRSSSATERRTMKPKKISKFSMFVNQPEKASTEKIRLWTNQR